MENDNVGMCFHRSQGSMWVLFFPLPLILERWFYEAWRDWFFYHFPLQCFLVTNVSRRSRKCISSVSPWELIFIYTWPTSEEGGKVSTWTWLEVWLRQDYRNCCVPTHQPDVCLLGLEGPVLAAVHSSHSVSTDVCHIKMNHFFFFFQLCIWFSTGCSGSHGTVLALSSLLIEQKRIPQDVASWVSITWQNACFSLFTPHSLTACWATPLPLI